MVRWRGQTARVLLFVFVIACIEMGGQTPSVVSPSDISDWWSLTGRQTEPVVEVQHRELADANFRIVGIDLHDFTFAKLFARLGKTHSVQRGDASTWREQACYISHSAEHPTYLIFERGEVNASFYLFSEVTAWNGQGRCTPLRKNLDNLETASGLHVGQTPEQVIGILGQPSERQKNELVYAVESKRKTEPDALARARKQHPELNEEQFHRDYGTYDLSVFVRVKFSRSKMVYLGISVAETN